MRLQRESCVYIIYLCREIVANYSLTILQLSHSSEIGALALASALLKMLKFLVKDFMCLYFLKFWMDQVDTLHVGRYWSEVLCCTIMAHLGDLEVTVKVTDRNFVLKFLVKVFISLYLLKLLMDQVDTLHVGRYWYEVLCCIIMPHLGDLDVKVTDLKILC